MYLSCLCIMSLWLEGAAAIFDQNGVPRQVGLRIPTETAAEAKERHERIAKRRQETHIICHRGASEFAHENTLEAYRATFELGADGNEIDIRTTKDGVLVCFHDDMLDHLLEAYGDVSDFAWEELRRFKFREPGPFGKDCRIPTLVEVFDLHRKYGGLLHLDIKRPGQDRAIADLLDRMDMWDHIAYCNEENGGIILRHPKLRLCRYKGPGLYVGRSEVDPQAIAEVLDKPGDGVIVDDPRGVLVALGRCLGRTSSKPVAPITLQPGPTVQVPPVERLLAILRSAEDWNRVAESPEQRAASGRRIQERAQAADQILAAKAQFKEAFVALEDRVHHRSLHKDWQYQGLDGAMALRSLILLHAPNAVELARFALWLDDPGLEPVVNPRWNNPRSWTDFRMKMVIFPALQRHPGAATEQLCRDYLVLTDEAARKTGPPLFAEAAKTLLIISPRTETALELMKHRLSEVRGQAILGCLRNGKETWARVALDKGAPHALAFIVSDASPVFPLKKAESGRFLIDQNGKPFLVVGDSAWSLIVQPGEKEIDHYLEDRAKRGFNSVIVNLIEHKFCTDPPRTSARIAPFLNAGDFSTPNPAYFDFARQVIKKANNRGIVVWLFPAYLGSGGGDEGWFREMKASGKANLRAYGRFVAKRFRDLPNIVWVVGGDFTPAKADQWTVTEMAEGIREEDPTHLMTAHGAPAENSAVVAFGEQGWLTVNAAYSYEKTLFRPLLAEYHRRQTRPFVLLESVYEGEHDSKPEGIRRQAYWAILSGACGQFFGNNPIWHFDGPGLYPFKTTWQKALDGTGSRDMARLRQLFVEMPWHQLVPEENHVIVPKGYGRDFSTILAARTTDNKLAIIYVPSTGAQSQDLTVDLGQFSGPVTARWYNPTNGRSTMIGDEPLPNLATRTFHTPGDNGTKTNDWLLILKVR